MYPVGTLQRLPKLLGNASLVRDMAYTARRVPAEEMQAAGFLSEVCTTCSYCRRRRRRMFLTTVCALCRPRCLDPQVHADQSAMLVAALAKAGMIAGKSPVG